MSDLRASTTALLAAACLATAGLGLAAPSALAHARTPSHACLTRRGRLVAQRRACGAREVTLRLRRATSAGASAKVVTTCVNRKGEMRVVSSRHRCRRHERKLTWDVEGPRGNEGAAGSPRTLVPFETPFLEIGEQATIFNEDGIELSLKCTFNVSVYESKLVVDAQGIAHAAIQLTAREEEKEFGLPGSGEELSATLSYLEPDKPTTIASLAGGDAREPYEGYASGYVQVGDHAALIAAYLHSGNKAHEHCVARGTYMLVPATPFKTG